jgi:hypothetical protein
MCVSINQGKRNCKGDNVTSSAEAKDLCLEAASAAERAWGSRKAIRPVGRTPRAAVRWMVREVMEEEWIMRPKKMVGPGVGREV